MKMPYEKPMMAIERYELTQSIASCDLKIGYSDSQCVIKDAEATNGMKQLAYSDQWFSDGCTNQVTFDMVDENGTCYHTNANAAFLS